MDAASVVESPWVIEERNGEGPETGAVPGTGETVKPADTRESGNARETRDLRNTGNAHESRNPRNIIESLGNLLYLIQLDAERPDRVRDYTVQAEERLRALIALLPERALPRDPHHGLKLVPAHGSSNPE